MLETDRQRPLWASLWAKRARVDAHRYPQFLVALSSLKFACDVARQKQ